MIKNSGLYDTIMVIITNSKGYSEVIPINRLSIQREPIFYYSQS